MCNGSTADSDSVRLGSNPGSAAKTKTDPCGRFFVLLCPNRICVFPRCGNTEGVRLCPLTSSLHFDPSKAVSPDHWFRKKIDKREFVDFLSNPKDWYGINAPRALYGIAAGVWHRAKRVSNFVPLRMDAIHHFVMIPCDCFAINSIPQQVADSIHSYAVIWRESLAISPILCYTNHRKAFVFLLVRSIQTAKQNANQGNK